MSTPVLTITNTFRAILYDGTNGSDVVAQFGVPADSDDGTTLKFTPPGQSQHTVTAGQYVVWIDDSGFGGTPMVQFNLDELPHSRFQELCDCADVESPGEDPTSAPVLTPVLVEVQAEGYATLPGSALGGNQTIDVTLSPALPHDGYRPGVELRGSAGLLSGHSISSHQVLDEQTVRVVVNSGALSVAGQVRVWAVASVLEFTSP